MSVGAAAEAAAVEPIPEEITLEWDQRVLTVRDVALNGDGNAVDAAPGEPLRLDFRWQIRLAETSDLPCPGCFRQFYYGLMDAEAGFSRCLVSRVRLSHGESTR